ncbi:MAG: hypothetical protein VX050_00135 [Planctomycetota bacterium]|nr:hypothetical protein [Planctomycetota bacterium]
MPKFNLKRDRIAANPRTGEAMKKERFCPILALLLIGLCGCWSPAQSSLSPNVPEVLAALESEGWDIAFVEPSSGRIQTEPRNLPKHRLAASPTRVVLEFRLEEPQPRVQAIVAQQLDTPPSDAPNSDAGNPTRWVEVGRDTTLETAWSSRFNAPDS